MNRDKHLTREQLFGYAADSLDSSQVDEVGKHLLLCADCRRLLPVPTPQQFLAMVLGETEYSEQQQHSFEESSLMRARCNALLSLLLGGRKLAWSAVGAAGALILVAGFSFLIWQATIKPSDPAELARTTVIESNRIETPIDENPKDASDEKVLKNEETESLTLSAPPSKKLKNSPSPPVTEQSGRKLNRTEDVELAQIIENTPAAVLSLRPKGTAVLRSNPDNSEPKRIFSLIGPVGETVLDAAPEFRWEKAAGAESYKITIFDAEFNEVLTATVSGTRFKPDAALTPGAKYLWRVAAQTADGEIIAPSLPQPPAIFQIASKTAETRIQFLKKSDDQFKLAQFYASEGMLDLAHCALKRILLQNSEHRAAKRLLAKVARWQKENKTVTQRCGVEPLTNADRRSDETSEDFR
jgi:hypothetical protein